MLSPEHRSARLNVAWPALLATVLLLIVLLGAYTLIESRRLQRNLSRELEGRADESEDDGDANPGPTGRRRRTIRLPMLANGRRCEHSCKREEKPADRG